MLRELAVRNFRGFEDHAVPIRRFTVIVGRNNAGKSTLVEAIRLVALIARRSKSGAYEATAPSWLTENAGNPGVVPGRSSYDLEEAGLIHRFGDPPGHIEAAFDGDASLTIWVGGSGELYGTLRNRQGNPIKDSGSARAGGIPEFQILPQVGPVELREEVLDDGYVRRNLTSRRAPLHFRNQLRVLRSHAAEFRRLAENTWPRLQVRDLRIVSSTDGATLSLFVRDGDFVGELAMMGHGLQMWLQVMWFLARAPRRAIIVLDEPDVYLHADLQRKLIRIVRQLPNQVIVATHSTEIMAEVAPEEVLVLDRKSERSEFVTDVGGIQAVVDDIGSIHNLHLTRLLSSRRFLAVEGEDIHLLKAFQDLVCPQSLEPIDAIPRVDIPGRGEVEHVTRWPALMKKVIAGEQAVTYCIVDSDCLPPDFLEETAKHAEAHDLQLHQWSRKEIENYLLVAGPVQRLIARGCPDGAVPPTEDEVQEKIDEFARDLEQDTMERIAGAYQHRDRGLELCTAMDRARAYLEPFQATPEGRLACVSGKEVVKRLSTWAQEEFGASLGTRRIARELRRGEVDEEVVDIILAIEHCEPFPAATGNG